VTEMHVSKEKDITNEIPQTLAPKWLNIFKNFDAKK